MVENIDSEGGWLTLFLVLVAYLFLAYQKRVLLMKE